MEGIQQVIEEHHEDLNLEMQMNEIQLNSGEYNEVRVVLNDPIRHLMTTAVSFDSHEQLTWTGSHSGHVTSYYGPSLMKYTAFQAHHSEVRKILPDAHGVLSLCPNEVRYTTKQGLKIFSASVENMQSMRSMVRGNGFSDNYVLLAGQNEHFFELDLTSGYVSEKTEVSCEPNTVVVKQSNHYLCCGQQTGQVVLHDPQSLEVCHTLEAHSGALSDFDFHGNLLVTSGFSTSRYGHLNVDPYLMVYDLRTLRAFPPVQVPIEPYFVRFMPTYTLRCLVMSLTGQFVFCQPDSLVVDHGLYQLNNQGSHIMDCCVSETYQCLCVGDEAGYVHLWADRTNDQISFNHQTQDTVFPDEIQMLDAFAIDDWSIPLTSIPMPECSEPLLSDWPEHLLKRADRPTPPIDPDILKGMTIRQFVGYAPNPKKRLRNQVAYNLSEDGERCPESPMSRDQRNSMIPKMYRKVDIKYSKYGVEDFNFQHYNNSPFNGLEIHIPNAYCNSMLQVLYYLDPLRILICNHLCQEEFCLSCELGFLFHMLDIADDQTCQATNFLRTFRTLPEASALGLLKNENSQRHKNMIQIIQNWNRFVLRQLHQGTREKKEDSEPAEESKRSVDVTVEGHEEEKPQKTEEDASDEKEEKNTTTTEKDVKEKPKFEEPSVIKTLFGMDILSCRTCKCGDVEERKGTIFSIDLVYPELKEDDDESFPFARLLNNSLIRQERNSSWCNTCKKYQNAQQERKVVSMPDVLNINCLLERDANKVFWRKQLELLQPKVSATKNLNSSPPKICRYGKFCNRQECKFVHPGRDGEQKLSTSDADGGLGTSLVSWLPPFIQIKHSEETNKIEIVEFKPDDEMEAEGTVYKLTSNVCHIQDSAFDSTLVAHILVSGKYHQRKGSNEIDQWYVFNDFAITPVSEVDVFTFNLDWKVPCVLIYSRTSIADKYTDEVVPQIESSILFADKSLAVKQSRFSRNFTPLNSTEILKEGDIVGVDAEFVTLNQEESEMKRDGTLSTLRPSQMSVARITVVRGWGPLEGVPFIDDYISTSEQVVDYLTKFSGIKPGDLDATSSSKHLTTLKTSYQKLRYLTDAKVLFVGHGLKKDFRVINLVVPRDRVVDTVELFHLPKQRFVSLKFLAWYFLKIKIQEDTHDSAEDAYTALKLYSKYRELLRAGEWVLEEELEILYETGRQYNWQVPD